MVAAGYQLGLTSDRSLRKKNESHLNQKFIHSSSPARSAVEDDFLAPVSINHVSCILYHKCIRYHKSCITSVSYSHQLTILLSMSLGKQILRNQASMLAPHCVPKTAKCHGRSKGGMHREDALPSRGKIGINTGRVSEALVCRVQKVLTICSNYIAVPKLQLARSQIAMG